MWVADMNFATVPTVTEAIIARAGHPAFGYFREREEYSDSIIRWHEIRNHVTGLTKEAIGYENGVLGCVVSAADAFCSTIYCFILRPTSVLPCRWRIKAIVWY